MHAILLLCITATLLCTRECSNQCMEVGTFTFVCSNDNIVYYIISASPCISDVTVFFTLYNTNTLALSTTKHLDTAIKNSTKFDDPLGNVDVSMRWHLIDPHITNFRKQLLCVSVTVKPSNITFQVEFPMFSETCYDETFINKPKKEILCSVSRKLGQYSSACLIDQDYQNRTTNKGLYILTFDVCTVPYSVSINYISRSNQLFHQAYTQDKTDTIVNMQTDTKCGVQLLMNDHNALTYKAALVYVCQDTFTSTLIVDHFFTNLAMNCPLSRCKEDSKLKHSCEVPWIFKKDTMVTAHMNVSLNLCSPLPEVVLDMYIRHKENEHFSFPFHQTMVLVSDHVEDMHDKGNAIPLHLGIPLFGRNLATNNGYLGLDLGNISLYIHDETFMKHVMIVRHYPQMNDGISLLHTEFWVRTSDVCTTASRSSHGKAMIIGVSVPCVIVLVLVITVVVIIKNRKRPVSQSGAGLPFHIELHEDDEC